MNSLRYLQLGLRPKLFLSYLAVIAVGTMVMSIAAQGVAPTTFSRHMTGMMGGMMAEMMGSSSTASAMPGMEDLFAGFRRALSEAVLFAAGASLLAAAVISYFVSRAILSPVGEMMAASKEMVSGRYSRRVKVPGGDELGALARNFNALAEALESTEERRQQLIADLAHELRTPLTTIKSHMEGLQDGVLPADSATYELVNREAERLARLVEDLQELSRAEAKELALRTRPIAVTRVVAAAISRMNPQYQAKSVALEHSVAEPLPEVVADEDRIIQVLLNLLGNALRYTPTEGRVQIQTTATGREIRFVVQDTGAGISAEDLPHVFDRFFRADRSRARTAGGSGLGLTIARYIVEAHGGRIWAESPGLGRGSTFSFTLPAR